MLVLGCGDGCSFGRQRLRVDCEACENTRGGLKSAPPQCWRLRGRATTNHMREEGLSGDGLMDGHGSLWKDGGEIGVAANQQTRRGAGTIVSRVLAV